MLEERKETLRSDIAAIKEFSVYNEKWEAKTLSEIEKVKADIAEKQEQIQALETEQNLLKVHICENQEEEKRLTEDLRQICGQLALFERLIGKLEEENSLARDLEAAERKLRQLPVVSFLDYLCTLPEPSPPASFSTSGTVTML